MQYERSDACAYFYFHRQLCSSKLFTFLSTFYTFEKTKNVSDYSKISY